MLDISSTETDDESVEKLVECFPSLKSLSLSKTRICSPSSLTKLAHLFVLDISSNTLDKDPKTSWSFLTQIKSLGFLKADNMDPLLSEPEKQKEESKWDEFVFVLSQIKSLKALNLSCSAFSEEACSHLSALSELKSLDLTKCPSITFKAVKKIKGLKLWKMENL